MYNKLFTKILDSSIWLAPDPHRLVWITFLAAMDEDGNVMFASCANVAARARVTREQAAEAIAAFESPDPDSGDPDNEGRRIERFPGGWHVLNAAKYRALVTKTIIREQTRVRVANYRARNAGVTQPKRDANARVTPSEALALARAESIQDPPPPDGGSPPVDPQDPPPVNRGQPPPQKSQKKSRATAASKPDGVDSQVWSDWLQLRRAKKAPVTETVISHATAQAAQAGLSLDEFLRVWCARGTQGLMADWLKPQERAAAAYQPTPAEQRVMESVSPELWAKHLKQFAPPAKPITEVYDVSAKRLG